MTMNTTILPFRKPEDVEDPLTAVLRDGGAGCLHRRLKRRPRRFWPR
jgi:hypothetical protein